MPKTPNRQESSSPKGLLSGNGHDVSKGEEFKEEFILSIVNNPDICIICRELDGKIKSWNVGAEKLFGYTAAEAVGQHISLIIPPDNQSEEKDIDDRLKKEKKCQHYKTVRVTKDAKFVKVSITNNPIFDAKGQIVGETKMIIDITEFIDKEKKTARLVADLETAEKKLQTVYRFQQEMIDHIPDPIFMKDQQHRWIGGNKAFWALMGGPPENFLGKSDYDFFPKSEADVFWEKDIEVFNSCEVSINEEFITDSKNARHILSTKKASFVNEDGDRFLVGVIREITDLKTVETRLQKYAQELDSSNQALKAALGSLKDHDQHKDEFLAMLAHELRNPLTPIRNALDIWRSSNLGEKAQKELQIILDRQLQKIVRLVDDLLDVSRITRGTIIIKKDTIDLAQLISQTVESQRHQCDERQHKISLLLPKEKVFVKGDAIRLEQVVSNLLINACKYTEPGGHITVKLEREIDSALIWITDNGVGISPELLPHIFDLFVQAERSLDRAQGGLGIGLTLVRRLVELQGGNVEAKSQGLNKGSEFIVRLPIVSEVEVALPVTQPVAPQKTSLMKRILVIDDNADASMTARMMLELQGHTVETAVDGFSGIKVAQAFKPEVILLDIGLPGMDGYEVARRLRKLPETEKVMLIALSGYGQAEDRRRSKEAGCDHHLVKPADAAKLQALISG